MSHFLINVNSFPTRKLDMCNYKSQFEQLNLKFGDGDGPNLCRLKSRC